MPLRSAGRIQRWTSPRTAALPTWPLTGCLALYPLWWFLGLADVIWIVAGIVMALYLGLRRGVRAPAGFGLWLVFLVWMLASISQLDTAGRVLVFTYRAALYLAAAAFVLYVYNARARLTERFVTGLLTVFWAITVAGGYLGMLLPSAVFRTPMSYLLPGGLLQNELVNYMVIRRFAQYNAEGFVLVDPRPSAPFLYTNNWGNAYSLLMPFVIAYLWEVRGTPRFWVIAALLPVSVVPALATLNRGMFLGLAVAAGYVAMRYLLLGRLVVVLLILGVALTGALAFTASSASDQITDRVTQTSTTQDRVEIYSQTLASARESPLLGKGGPRPSANPNIPPVGTHGQFWMVLHSHGIPAVMFFIGFFVVCFLRSASRTDPVGILLGSVVLVSVMEMFYYGFLPSGLFLLVIAAALAVRGPDHPRGTP